MHAQTPSGWTYPILTKWRKTQPNSLKTLKPLVVCLDLSPSFHINFCSFISMWVKIQIDFKKANKLESFPRKIREESHISLFKLELSSLQKELLHYSAINQAELPYINIPLVQKTDQ